MLTGHLDCSVNCRPKTCAKSFQVFPRCEKALVTRSVGERVADPLYPMHCWSQDSREGGPPPHALEERPAQRFSEDHWALAPRPSARAQLSPSGSAPWSRSAQPAPGSSCRPPELRTQRTSKQSHTGRLSTGAPRLRSISDPKAFLTPVSPPPHIFYR